MIIENTNQVVLKKLAQKDTNVVYATLVPYKQNTCIKVYSEDGEPIGDIPQEDISLYLEQDRIVLFVEEGIDDDTGLPSYILKTIV